ncbi:MAG: enoyl-CoA hydratase/isomerase family protein, partial [Polyangiaceae bacterium]
GQNLPMDKALGAGLVHKTWATETTDKFIRAVLDFAHTFCPPTRSGLAVGQIKRAIQGGADVSLERGLAFERELQQRLFASPDAKEGFAAFTQKRVPTFRAR